MAKKTEQKSFDIAAYQAELNEWKKSKRQPVVDELETVKNGIAELESKRAELQSILDSIDGVERRATKKRGGGSPSNLPKFKGSAEDVAKVFKGDQQLGRAEIADALGVAADVALTNGIKAAADAKLIKKVAGTSSRGTKYQKA